MRAHALDVTAGTERLARAGDQQRADTGFSAAGADHRAQRRCQIVRQRVARFGAVQRDNSDAVADDAEEFIGAGVDGGFGGHGVLPFSSLRSAVGEPINSVGAKTVWWVRVRYSPYGCLVGLSPSKLLHPGPQLQLPAPGATRLLQHVPIALRDRIGIEHRIRLVRGSVRAALRMPPSMTKCATWMPCGDNSRAMLCASPRSANLPIANGAVARSP